MRSASPYLEPVALTLHLCSNLRTCVQCIDTVLQHIDPFVDLNVLFHDIKHRNVQRQAEQVPKSTQVVGKLTAIICGHHSIAPCDGDAGAVSSTDAADKMPSAMYSTLLRAQAHRTQRCGQEQLPWSLFAHRTGSQPTAKRLGTNWCDVTSSLVSERCRPLLLLYELQSRECKIPLGRGRFNANPKDAGESLRTGARDRGAALAARQKANGMGNERNAPASGNNHMGTKQ